eukprot:1670134-Heterocapsa_arctica.AAC.1
MSMSMLAPSSPHIVPPVAKILMIPCGRREDFYCSCVLADVVDLSLLCDQPPSVLLHGVAAQLPFIMRLATVKRSPSAAPARSSRAGSSGRRSH